jgi:hypothetical protein
MMSREKVNYRMIRQEEIMVDCLAVAPFAGPVELVSVTAIGGSVAVLEASESVAQGSEGRQMSA